VHAGAVSSPEGPGAALHRAHRVDAASSFGVDDRFLPLRGGALDLLLFQEDAVVLAAGVPDFLEARVLADGAAILLNHFFSADAEELGEPPDLLAADPDVPRPAGAAVAALRAGEVQPLSVPRPGGLFCVIDHI